MSLSEKNLAFVMHCGEMGSRWGFNRTIGQMCGLLTITKEPMTANEIADTLSKRKHGHKRASVLALN